MKKNLFMAALALAAGTAFAAAQTDYSGVYSGLLTVNVMGTTDTQDGKSIEIYPGAVENSVSLVLRDLTVNLSMGGSVTPLPMGDIIVTDIPVENGSMTLDDYPFFVEALPMTVSIDMQNSTFADNNLTVNMTIDAGFPVPVSFTGTRTLAINEGAYQVRNSGFEGEWEYFSGGSGTLFSPKWEGYEPPHWNSFTTAQATGIFAVAVNGDQLKSSADVRPGSAGSKSALVLSKYTSVLGVTAKANGNLTTGRINAGSSKPTDFTNNYNFSDPTIADNDDFLCPFVGAPDSLTVWAKYQAAPGDGSKVGSVTAAIHNSQRYQDPEAGADYSSAKVADTRSDIIEGDWRRISVPFTYSTTLPQDSAKYILISFSTNVEAGGGNTSSSAVDQLWVDDLEMVYNSRLSSLTVGDETVSLADGVYEYDLTQTLAADANPVVEATVDGKAASYVTGFNRADNTAAVIVRGGDFAANPANVHTYTLRFAEPQGPGTGFDTPAMPQATLYTQGNMLYILSAEAVQVEVYAVDGRLLTLTNEQVISLPSNGVYVVRVNGETHKVVAQ